MGKLIEMVPSCQPDLIFLGSNRIVPKFGKLKPKTCKPTINCSGINTTKVDSHSSSCWYLLLLTFLHSVTTFNLDCSQETRLSQILLDAQRESEIQLMSSEPAHWSPHQSTLIWLSALGLFKHGLRSDWGAEGSGWMSQLRRLRLKRQAMPPGFSGVWSPVGPIPRGQNSSWGC